jgi:anti-sigma regulatory factor (Ser/Thr protein kinase)
MELQYEPVNPDSIFHEIKDIFSLTISQKGLTFIMDIAPDISESPLLMDDVRLRQILFNIVGNAVKFTEKGQIKLSARKTVNQDDPNTIDLIIAVEDTGIGIDPESHGKIFEAFRQQDGQSTKKYGGTGLGLTISKRLVEMMKGTIAVKSQVNKGSRFEIVLNKVAIDPSGVKQPTDRAPGYEDHSVKKEKEGQESAKGKGAEREEPESLLPEALAMLPEIISKLENEHMNSWKNARQNGLFDDIAHFGHQIKEYGHQCSLKILQQFGDDLILQVSTFDIEKMMATLDSYPGLITKVKLLPIAKFR